MRVVVIGNGVAGIEAAITVKEREPSWDVTVVSEESDHFFSRTALMYVASGQLSHRCIEPHDRELYPRLGLRRVRARATGLDPQARTVALAGGLDALPFDRLLIASGSRPRPAPWPGAELAGVGHFVTLQDLEWLERELWGGPGPRGRPPRADAHLEASDAGSPYRVRRSGAETRGRTPSAPTVIGGGLVGIEVVEVMLARGLRPRFFMRDDHFWPIALDPAEAGWIAERMREHGVDVRLGEDVARLEGDAAIERVVSTSGAHDCDLCVVAIGVVPNTEWLADGGLSLDPSGGVVVDEGLETSVEGIFAAGDCASVRWFDGGSRPEQLWYTARAQGRVAGRRLCGERASYVRGTWYNSAKLMDIEYTSVGLVNVSVEDQRTFFYEERGAVRSTTRIVRSGERVVGFNLLGRRWDHAVMQRWIEERRPLGWVLDHLAEAAFDTELVPPLTIPRAARDAAPDDTRAAAR